MAIASSTRLEWILADLAVACAGGVTATVYPVSTEEDTSFILTDSRAAIVFAEDAAQARRIAEPQRRPPLPSQSRAVRRARRAFRATRCPFSTSRPSAARGTRRIPAASRPRPDAAGPSDLATLIYTSGTTGRPKGVELPHDCWLFEIESIGSLNLLGPSDLQFLWLPLAHVFGKVCVTLGIGFGFPTAVDGRVDRLAANLASVKPTFVCVVPRIFEKVHAKILEQVRAGGKAKAAIFRWALRVGTEVARRRKRRAARRSRSSRSQRRARGRARPPESPSALRRAPPLLHLRQRRRSRASSPSSSRAFGVTILEGYGLSESTAMTVSNLPDRNRWGTVGIPIPGIEVSFAEDGEILLRGRGIMRGYFGLPEETAARARRGRLAPHGRHRRPRRRRPPRDHRPQEGPDQDLGREVRRAADVEGLLKLETPVIAQVLLHGEGRRFCVALVSLSEEELLAWARGEGIARRALRGHPARRPVVELIRRHVEHVNAHLARHEAIRRWAILPAELKVETGELTPSLKVRRRLVEQKYRDILEGLYAEGPPPDSP